MNERFLYAAMDIAAVVSSMNLGCREEAKLLDALWTGEQNFLAKEYRSDKRRYLLDVAYWMHYFYDKPVLDQEFPAIQKDLESSGHQLDASRYQSETKDLDLFFKNMRLRILYGGGQTYVRIKLRTLLAKYGYKRRTKRLMAHIYDCMTVYRLDAATRGGLAVDIESCSLDTMLTFRVG